MRRLLIIAIGLLTVWFGLLGPTSVMANSALTPTANEYGSHVTPMLGGGTATEGGPHATHEVDHDAVVDRWSCYDDIDRSQLLASNSPTSAIQSSTG